MRLIQKVKIRLLNYVNQISKYKVLYKKKKWKIFGNNFECVKIDFCFKYILENEVKINEIKMYNTFDQYECIFFECSSLTSLNLSN